MIPCSDKIISMMIQIIFGGVKANEVKHNIIFRPLQRLLYTFRKSATDRVLQKIFNKKLIQILYSVMLVDSGGVCGGW